MPRYVGEDEAIKMNAAIADQKTYTVKDMEALPEDVRAELIDGHIFYMAPPPEGASGVGKFSYRHYLELYGDRIWSRRLCHPAAETGLPFEAEKISGCRGKGIRPRAAEKTAAVSRK